MRFPTIYNIKIWLIWLGRHGLRSEGGGRYRRICFFRVPGVARPYADDYYTCGFDIRSIL